MRHGGRWPHSLAGAGKAAEEEQPLSSRLQALQRKSKGFGLHPRPAKRFPLPAPVKLQGWEAKSSRSWAGGFPHVFSHTILTLSSDTLCQIPSLFTLKSLCTGRHRSCPTSYVCIPSAYPQITIYCEFTCIGGQFAVTTTSSGSRLSTLRVSQEESALE